MTENEETIVDKLQKIDLTKLKRVTFEEIMAKKPKIFGDDSFDFSIGDLSGALEVPDFETKVGFGDMYVLDTKPLIYTFSNAYGQLRRFCKKNNLKSGSKITYLKKFIPEGKTSFDTQYLFEEAKKMEK